MVHAEREAGPIAGVIVQLGGQTPLGLAQALKDEGVPIVGTSPEAIHLAEDRGAFGRVLAEAKPARAAPRHGVQRRGGGRGRPTRSATRCWCGPSYVLGGRGMEIVYDDETLSRLRQPGHPRVSPSTRCWSTGSSTTRSRSTWTRCTTATEMYLGGIMEHIEEAGIHSGDSACVLPPVTLGRSEVEPGPRVDAQAGARGSASRA